MDRLLKLTALLEGATGLALLAAPSLVVRWLLSAELSGAGIPLGRVGGLGLLSLGIACWPGRDATGDSAAALRAMLTYNSLATLYLFSLGVGGAWVGPLLWPAVVLHAALTLWCVAYTRRVSAQDSRGSRS